jgi:hypothetical protein
MSGVLPPIEVLTPDNHGALVTICGTVLACFSGCAAAVRVHVALRQKQHFGLDDALYFTALVRLCFSTPALTIWLTIHRPL